MQIFPISLSQSKPWALVPLKRFEAAKTRLSPLLSSDQRQKLVFAMACDVLTCLKNCDDLGGIAIVSAEPAIEKLSQQFGATWIKETCEEGLNAALTMAVQTLADAGVQSVLCIPGDVPLITPDKISTILAGHQSAPAVTLVPASNSNGTNAILCSPPTVVPFCFGEDSYQQHQRAASLAGISTRSLKLAHIDFDLDTPNDLIRLLATQTSSAQHTLALLNQFPELRQSKTIQNKNGLL